MGGVDGPFLGTEALADGRVTRRGLKSGFRPVYRNVYMPKNQLLTPTTRAKAAWLWAGRRATLGGLSAAAVHGSKWIDAKDPADLFRLGDAVEGINIYRDNLAVEEICVVDGMPITTPARTAYDLGRRDILERAVIRLDALANATTLEGHEVAKLIDRHAGSRGIVQLRNAVELMDGGAESPQETRTRLLLMSAGFPRPQTQILVCDVFGYFIGRVDMGWPEWKVGVEYDGPQHWASSAEHARTIERIADLEAEGWIIIRITRDIMRYRRGVFLARVRDAMRTAGWPHCDQIRLDAQIWRDRAA
jgi:hypothetical protein